mmetsp:Transcript_23898/g.74328  ORF Transcript_23898/g.74328 Transcript_23898/m.74328 type:complete len:293 (-) Transcript_23898:172-1050(-)
MVCAFGLGPEATTWLASKGVATLGGLRKHSEAAAADFAPAPLSREGGRGHRGTRDSAATVFNEPKKGDEKDEEGEKKGMGCFPASASVYVKGRGPVRVGELRQGDLLLCGDACAGHLLFSPFLGHLHLKVAVHADYIVLEMAGGSAKLIVSQEHLVFAASSKSTPAAGTRAGELRAGDWLSRVSCDGGLDRVQISAVSKVAKEGVYCPLTECGTVVVDGTLCSCYADAFQTAPAWLRRFAATHEAAHGALFPLRLACRLSWGSCGMKAKLREGIHPFCRALMALPMTAHAIT